MIFLFKKKPIKLLCVTRHPPLLKSFPVRQTVRFVPSWWRCLPKTFRASNSFYEEGTMKWCSGFVDLYKQGVTIPMWSDVALQIGAIGTEFYRYQFADNFSEISVHPSQQHGNSFSVHEYQHIKFICPWHFVCSENIPFLYVPMTWSSLKFKTFNVVPGIMKFNYGHETHINAFITRTDKVQELLIPANEPIVQVIPLSDRPLKIELSDDISILEKAPQLFVNAKFANRKRSLLKITESLNKDK